MIFLIALALLLTPSDASAATLLIFGATVLGSTSLATAGAIATAVSVVSTAATLASVGYSIYQAANAPGAPSTEGPRLGDLSIQSSARGAPLAKVWGSMRISGNVIHGKKYEERSEESVGGKGFGGGGGTQVTYHYFADLAISLCEGPIEGIRRVWMNNKLWYDVSDTASDDVVTASEEHARFVKLYKGTSTQLPDPTLEAIHGAGNVPPYRHTAYLVFTRLPLADFGNAIPNVSVEIVNTPGAVPATTLLPGDAGGTYNTNMVRDPLTGRLFRTGFDDGVIEVLDRSATTIVQTITLPGGATGVAVNNPVSTPCYVPSTREIWSQYDTTGLGCRMAIVNADTLTLKTTFSLTLTTPGLSIFNPTLNEVWAHDNYNGDGAARIPISTRTPAYADPNTPGLTHTAFFVAQHNYIVLAGYPRWMQIRNASTYDILASYTAGAFDVLQQNVVYDSRRDVIYWSNGQNGSTNLYTIDLSQALPASLPAARTLPKIPSAGMIYHRGNDLIYLFELSPSYSVYGIDPDTLAVIVTIAQAIITPARYLADLGIGPFLISGDTRKIALRATFANNGTTLGDIVAEICQDAGVLAGDRNTTELTQTVHGYVRAQPMEAQAAIAPLMTAYLFDAQESEYKIKFVKRTQASVAALLEDDIGAHESGQELPDPLLVTRGQEVELPQSVSIHYVDPAKDYQQGSRQRTRVISRAVNKVQLDLPIAMSSTEAGRLVLKIMNVLWVQRHRYALTAPIANIALDPADVITVQSDLATHKVRLTRVDFGTPGMLRLEGTAVRVTTLPPLEAAPDTFGDDEPVYVDDAEEVAPPDTFPAPTTPIITPSTWLVVLDIPILRDADNDSAFYFAMAGYSTGWLGGTLWRSSDGGQTYTSIDAMVNAATIGGSIGVLADGPTTIWDHGATVTVLLTNGTLASDTEANVLAGANAAAFGAPGRWEILQFQTATLNADGSYTLSNLLRGRRGTEHNTANHQAGDVFVALSAATIGRVEPSTSELDQARKFKAVTAGQALADAAAIDGTNTGVGLECFSPVQIKGTRVSSGDLTITWQRRTRAQGEWLDLVDVPLFEDAELYDVEVLNGGTVVRTFTGLTASTQLYTSAQQVTDFGSNQSAVSVRAYQLSTLRARGYPGSATV